MRETERVSKFQVGDLVRHRASKECAVVVGLGGNEAGFDGSYRVSPSWGFGISGVGEILLEHLAKER